MLKKPIYSKKTVINAEIEMEYISERTMILKSAPQATRTQHQPVVYYVEDNDMTRKCTESLIRNWNYDVIPKSSPARISFDVFVDKIDVFVLDFEIKGFKPEHFLPYLEKSKIPIIFYSGHDEEYIRGFLNGAGYELPKEVFCITKPYTDQLKACIEAVIRNSQSPRTLASGT